ncbi:MAG TPA: protein kinase [Vicinamibacteria bacterium]|nr:protein kinase [Vicinamibacteria bacterium]
MSLTPGLRLGPYEISAAIGKGGMGEVFRARDTKLGREVAIKVLPAAFAQDAERLARFEREAKLLASLNHPNLAHVYGFESAALPDGSTAHFLAMEMVEGEDLAQRLKGGAIPADEAIAIAGQIADGLEEAHEHGIVHRDLKPANIKVTPDGKVKVLDFGLAKAFEGGGSAASVNPEIADSPTVSRHATEAGLILGTAAYMSPEQARGKAVDKRADIWSFGVVVFEMLTGERLFAGETVTDVLAAVLTREPDWKTLPAATPDALLRIVQRCLVRDPRRRLRDLGEVRLALDERGGGARVSSPTREAAAATPRLSRSGLAWFAAGILVAALAAVLVAGRRAAVPTSDEPTYVSMNLPPATRLAFGRGSAVALSPDGRRLAYTGASAEKTRLYLQSLDRSAAEVLPGTDGASNPFFSPDGQWIGFFADDKLKKVSLKGGAPVEVADVRNPRGEAWGPDDSIYLAVDNASGITRLSARDGSRREAATSRAPGEASHRWPALLPSEGGFLYAVWNNTAWDGSKIMARGKNQTGPREVVSAGGGYPRVLRDPARGRTYLIYARADGLLVAPFDEARLEVTGPAVPLVDGMVTNLSGGAHYDLSASGTLAYAPGANTDRDRSLAWVARDGAATPLPSTHGAARFWSLSKDGRKVARHTVGGERAIWIDDLETGNHQRAVVGERVGGGLFTFPIWAFDQGALVYSQGAPAPNLILHRLGASGGPAQLTRSERPQYAMSVSSDGRTLLYQEFGDTTASDLWTLPLPSPKSDLPAPVKGTPFLNSAASEVDGRISPDGRFVAYVSNDTGRFEIYVVSFPSGTERIQVSSDGGFRPEWAPQGNEILFRSPGGWLMSATFQGDGAPRAGKPRILFDASKYENVYSVSPDGKRFLMMPLLPMEGDATEVRLILNVQAEIRRRIPE